MNNENTDNHNSKNITESYRKIIFPVRLGIEPMERLLIADFKDDPEYISLEPQMFDDQINGKGLRVLRYRRDKRVDVYWQPGVYVDEATFNIGAGLGDFQQTDFKKAVFEIDDRGVHVHVVFRDLSGRTVELLIRENTSENSRLPFLAPVGNEIEKPKQFFLAYMQGFDFIRKKGTLISAKIGDRVLKPAGFPLLRNFRRVMFIRYSANPIVGTLNPPMDKSFAAEIPVPGVIEAGGMKISVDENGGVTAVTSEHRENCVEIEFKPPFPELSCMKNQSSDEGEWIFRISETVITGGKYLLFRDKNIVRINIDVTQHWKPVGLPLSLRLFTSILKFFRTWPSTYRWRGTVDLDNLQMTGKWERK